MRPTNKPLSTKNSGGFFFFFFDSRHRISSPYIARRPSTLLYLPKGWTAGFRRNRLLFDWTAMDRLIRAFTGRAGGMINAAGGTWRVLTGVWFFLPRRDRTFRGKKQLGGAHFSSRAGSSELSAGTCPQKKKIFFSERGPRGAGGKATVRSARKPTQRLRREKKGQARPGEGVRSCGCSLRAGGALGSRFRSGHPSVRSC